MSEPHAVPALRFAAPGARPDDDADDARVAAPEVADYTVAGRDGEEVAFRGRLLAESSSREADHTHAGPTAPPGWTCRACRWFEAALYELADDAAGDRYLVHTRGPSSVPGEIDYGRVARAESADKVVELLVAWRGAGPQRRPALPQASARLLAHAAAYVPDLAQAVRAWSAAGMHAGGDR